MKPYSNTALLTLLEPQSSPCVSIYMPTHRHVPDRQQDLIRYRNLLRQAEQSLLQAFFPDGVEAILRPFRDLASNERFWQRTLDGLAVLGTVDAFRTFRLRQPMPEMAVVAESYHVKPLLHVFQSTDRYHVLALTRKGITLYGGDRNGLDPVDTHPSVPLTMEDALGTERTDPHMTVASYGGAGGAAGAMRHGHSSAQDEINLDTERYFRAVDRAILEHHSRPTGLPLMLAALPEHQALFRSVSHNPFLIAHGIEANPESMSLDVLGQRAWGIVEPEHTSRLQRTADVVANAIAHGNGSHDLHALATAAIHGRVDTLLLQEGITVPGRLNAESGVVTLAPLDQPDTDDVLDDIAETVLRKRGTVMILPLSLMPYASTAAASFRY